jgi:hypothetical protein
MKNTWLLVIAVGVLFQCSAQAAVEPVIVPLYHGPSHGTNTYTVASGKALMIRQIWGFQYYTNAMLRIYGGPLTSEIYMRPQGALGLTTYDGPVIIPAECNLQLFFDIGSTDEVIFLFCLLVDISDLYASIPSSFELMLAAGSGQTMQLRLASPRPAILGMESSPDLAAWTPRPDISALATTSRCLYTFSDNARTDRAFYRALARARQ